MNDTLTLYEVSKELTELVHQREEILETLSLAPTVADQERLKEELEAAEFALKCYVSEQIRKVDNIHRFLKHESLTIAAIDSELGQMQERRKLHQNRVERLKAICVEIMLANDWTRLEGSAGEVIALQRNGGVAPLTIEESLLPPEYLTYSVTLPWDVWRKIRPIVERMAPCAEVKTAPSIPWIRHALGLTCEGCLGGDADTCLLCDGTGKRTLPGARLEERGYHVRIK